MISKTRLLIFTLFLGIVAASLYARTLRKQVKDVKDDLRKLEMVSSRQENSLSSLDQKYKNVCADELRFKNLYLEIRSTSILWKNAWLNAEGRRFRPVNEDPLLAHLPPAHVASIEKLRRPTSDLLREVFDFESDSIPGVGSWMHLRQEIQAVNCLTSVYLGAAEGITNVHLALKDRGVRLLFCPVPAKWSLHPESLAEGMAPDFDLNPQHTELIKRLNDAGVWAVDLAPAFREAFGSGRLERAFFLQDTHWTAAAIEFAAEQLAGEIRQSGIELPAAKIEQDEDEAVLHGGLASMLEELESPPAGFQPIDEPYHFFEVRDFKNAPAPVLVTGRSFSNTDATGIGKNIGLTPNLSFHLQSPVEHHSGGAIGLRSTVRNKPGFLDGKKIVIWILPMRDFWESPEAFSKNRLTRDLFGDGVPVEKSSESATGAALTVTATSPEIPASKLVYQQLISVFTAETLGQAPRTFYYQSVKDRKLLLPRFVRKGDPLRFRSIPWDEQTAKHPEFSTMTLDDPLSEPTDEIFFVTEWIDLPQ